ncbi:hypothetical protein HAX54_030228 [Datura stramonium]|uniref:Metallo-beta-lactamase domain-containing protein n=1 Tax=Datura stramonium TaxID=4076 RepID=A0ABS8SAS0_DATST|nr:hypothetical protein [Datura stramonium]
MRRDSWGVCETHIPHGRDLEFIPEKTSTSHCQKRPQHHIAGKTLASHNIKYPESTSGFHSTKPMIHENEYAFMITVDHSTTAVEIKLEGSGPWSLGDDVTLVHTPGHTEGSVCLLYKPRKVLFTGDHFAMGELGWTIYERYNKFSVPKQLNSVKLMLDLDFEWILPGHGRRTKFRDVEDKNSSLRAFLETKMQLL